MDSTREGHLALYEVFRNGGSGEIHMQSLERGGALGRLGRDSSRGLLYEGTYQCWCKMLPHWLESSTVLFFRGFFLERRKTIGTREGKRVQGKRLKLKVQDCFPPVTSSKVPRQTVT